MIPQISPKFKKKESTYTEELIYAKYKMRLKPLTSF